MVAPWRMLEEFAEPVARLMQTPGYLMPRRGTTLDRPRPLLPPGHVQWVPGAGELFYRDTGAPRRRAARGTILLLHGWMVPTDAHWFRTFDALHRQGWRVIALDARGHGRGLRTIRTFRFSDCAADAAALIEHLDCGPVTLVGYSMGGIIAQLIARNWPERVAGALLCATGCEFRTSLAMRAVWSSMGLLQVGWRLAPRGYWSALTKVMTVADPAVAEWFVAELARGAAWDIAEAGREIGRFDSRPWLEEIQVPTVVLVTLLDVLVPPGRQRDLAGRLGAPIVTLRADHLAPGTAPDRFHRALTRGLARLAEEQDQARVAA
jgi:3-oxoadipate enol-lactonase